MRVTYTGLLEVRAGCDTCHGLYDMPWMARNAQGVAARHHDATGHVTHVEQVITIQYGGVLEPRADQGDPR